LRILDKFPQKKGTLAQLKQLELPPEIKTLDWARLYPEYLVIDKKTVQIRPRVRIPKKWMVEPPAGAPREDPGEAGKHFFDEFVEARQKDNSKKTAEKTKEFFDKELAGRKRFQKWVETRQKANSEKAAQRTKSFFKRGG
jgi:hypothetical protein